MSGESIWRHRVFHPRRWRDIDVKVAWANWRIYRGNSSNFIQDVKLPYELVAWFILYGGILKAAWNIDVIAYVKEFAITATLIYILLFWLVGQLQWVKDLQDVSAKSARKHSDPETEEHLRITRELHEWLREDLLK